MQPPISRKLPPHNMIVIHQVGLDLYNLSYVKYIDHDIVQYIKHNLSSEDIAQFLGNN
jgi:hypothetical protein